MRRKVLLFVTVPSIIVLLALTASVSIKNASGGFANPVVTVTPSEADVGQAVLVNAIISVATGWGSCDLRDVRVSLTFPSQAILVSGDNPVYIGDMDVGESTTVNWTLTFKASGVFNLDVNASGYMVLTGEYTEIHGSANVTVIEPPPPPVGGGGAPRVRPLMK